jgi:hypothetical protein
MIGVQVLEKIPYTEQTYAQGITSGEIALMWINGMIWKIKNPNIPLVLYTDIETLELLKSYNITDSWDIINTDLLKEDIGINKSVFWSNSKFRVYKELSEPFVFIDCDILVWDDISEWNIFDYELVTSYKEELTLDCYIDPNIMISEYDIDYNSKWENMPLNTSFVYFNNDDPDSYKAHAYQIFRVYKGEDSLQNLIRFIRDVGDNILDESLIKQAKTGILGA